ncbi:hypothetical protein MN116_004915 [Schistosoma mekongi]|uniref:Uncharacterized protein n=1 Tax=Schistosoma mekongi TaxID=38744 RepID=A0AAE2D530_SCHME|nr:hypothetical protein MN116_004915 [Schistosoma mekongi]
MDNEKPRRKLILHFDARNTLFLSDKSYRFTVEEALNSYITGIVWGKLNDEPQRNGDNTVQNHSSNCNSPTFTPMGSTSDHLINTNDVNNDNQSMKVVKSQVTYEMNQDHSSELNSHKNINPVNSNINIKNCCRQPYAGEVFENLTSTELDHFKSTLACWNCLPESPCIRQPRPDSISIYKLLERQIVKTPSDRGRLRKYLGNFTQTPEGIPFRNLFIEHLEMLKLTPTESSTSPYCLYVNSRETNNCNGSNSSNLDNSDCYHYLMPAFFRLLTWLIETNRQFAIFIRTYGKDGEHILSAIEAYMNGEHPQEKAPINAKQLIPIDHTKWYLKRSTTKPMFQLYKETEHQDQGEFQQLVNVSNNPKEIQKIWSNQTGSVSVIDDFPYWQAHNYHYQSSKPVWFNPRDQNVQHILFDDNIRFEEDGSNVIDLQYLDENDDSITSVENNGSYSLDINDVMKWENIYFVQADLLEIIRNRRYFIEKVTECETNLDRIQKDLV